MAYTTIFLKRTSGSVTNSNCTFLSNNTGNMSQCEPWVQTNVRQLWIDSVCINPKLDFSATYGSLPVGNSPANLFSISTTQNSTNYEVTTAVKLDMTALYNQLVSCLTQDVQPFILTDGVDTYQIYNPYVSATSNLVLGNHLSYDDTTHTLDVDLSSLTYTGGNMITINNTTIDHNTTSVTSTTDAAILSSASDFTAITSIGIDTYGHITSYNTRTYTLPSITGSGQGSTVTQELQALGDTSISGNIYRNVTASLTAGSNTVRFNGTAVDSVTNDGNDIRFQYITNVNQANSATTYDVTPIIVTIDGGVIS